MPADIVLQSDFFGQIPNPDSKICTRCRKRLPYSEFSARANTPDQLDWYCRDCYSITHTGTRTCAFCRETLSHRRFGRPGKGGGGGSKGGNPACYDCRLFYLETGRLVCCDCGELLPVAQFTTRSNHWTGYSGNCRRCKLAESWHRKGIISSDGVSKLTWAEFDQQLELQGRRCYFCKCTEGESGWHADHHHETGVFRSVWSAICSGTGMSRIS